MNLTKEQVKPIIETNIDREWAKIKQYDFPPVREFPISEKELLSEFDNLLKKDGSWKTPSKNIIYFHPSMYKANKGGNDSPYEYWQKLKQDKGLFYKFYENRLCNSAYFTEKNKKHWDEIWTGTVPMFIYGIGLSTSYKAPRVSYFKPYQAKYLIKKYGTDINTVVDPFSGYSARMMGAWACHKQYIGSDLNDITVVETNKMLEFMAKQNVTGITTPKLSVTTHDAFSMPNVIWDNSQSMLVSCPPYSNQNGDQIEIWQNSKGEKIECKFSCDEIIEMCLDLYPCKRYVFVVDGSSNKYNEYVKETFDNVSYIGARNGKMTSASYNTEKIVVIEK